MHWSILGHTAVKEYLDQRFSTGTLPHAMLFEGPEGVGKCHMARDVAVALLSDSVLPLDGNPDFMMLTPTIDEETGKRKDISVDTIRERLRPWAYLRPAHGARKVAIIDDCDRMGEDAANTLLKVLEEPPTYVTFLLVSSASGAVMPTITSRCQHVQFHELDDADMNKAIAELKLSDEDRSLLAVIAQGRPGIAHALASGDGLNDAKASIASFEKALVGSLADRLILSKQVAERDDAALHVAWWLSVLRSRIAEHPELVPVVHDLLDLHDAIREPQFNRRLALERFWLLQSSTT